MPDSRHTSLVIYFSPYIAIESLIWIVTFLQFTMNTASVLKLIAGLPIEPRM